MACHADLPAEHAPLAYFCAARNAYLRRHHRVFSYVGVVGNLHQIIQFHAFPHIGTSHGGTVYARVGTYLYVVLYGDNAYLRYLVIATRARSETKTIRTNHDTSVQSDIVAQFASMVYRGVRVEQAILAHRDTFADNRMGINLASFANGDTITNVSEGTDINVLSNSCLRRNESHGINAFLLRFH